MRTNTLVKSLVRLAKDVGLDILELPINEFDSTCEENHPAYISIDGIFLSRELLTTDCANVHVYLAHEILHPVVTVPQLSDTYSSWCINIAEDFKINQYLLQWFGYDVKAVKIRGIRSSKYNEMSVEQICQHLVETGRVKKKYAVDNTQFMPHPLVLKHAEILKKRFSAKLGHVENKDLFYCDRMDAAIFYASYLNTETLVTRRIKNLDIAKTCKGLWSLLYLDKATHTAGDVERVLSIPEVLTYSFPAIKHRATTKENSDLALLTAMLYLKRIDIDARYLQYKIDKLGMDIDRVKARIALKRSKPKKVKHKMTYLKIKLARLQASLVKYRNMRPLPELLATQPVRMFSNRTATASMISLSSNLKQLTLHQHLQEVAIPNIDSHSEVVRRLRRLTGKIASDIEKTAKIKQALENSFGPLLDIPESEKSPAGFDDEEEYDQTEEQEQEEQQKESSEKEQEEEQKDSSAQETKTEPGDKTESSEEESEEESENELEYGNEDDSLTDPEQAMGGSGVGNGKGSNGNSVSPTNFVHANLELLTNILTMMNEIESQLSKKPNKSQSDNNGVATLYAYDNDVTKAVASEFGLLANKSTRLAFFAKLAQHSLLVMNPPHTKRYPVVLNIDGSGSMQGQFYATAVGFALAMIKLLNKDKRGVALNIFSTSIDKTIIIDENEDIDIMKLLQIICSPSFGGTDFDVPLHKSLDIKEQMHWNAISAILISDGYGALRDAAALRRREGPNDRLTAILVSNKKVPIKGLDETLCVKAKGLQMELVNLGNNIL